MCNIYISIQTLYSVLCFKHLWQRLPPQVILGMTLRAWHTCIWEVSPILLCRASLHSYFQVSPEMFDRVEVWALAGPLKDIQRLVSKPLLHCLCCVLRVISPQSELLCTLEQVFIKDLSLHFAPFIFPLILTSLPVPAAKKHPHSMMLPPPCFTVGMVPGFRQM